MLGPYPEFGPGGGTGTKPTTPTTPKPEFGPGGGTTTPGTGSNSDNSGAVLGPYPEFGPGGNTNSGSSLNKAMEEASKASSKKKEGVKGILCGENSNANCGWLVR